MIKHDQEYAEFLNEQEKRRKETIENECKQGRHNWNHYYGGYARCGTCGEDQDK